MSVRSLRYNTIEQHFTKGVTASTDRDALAFLEAAQIYNANQQRAIVNLVRSLKRVGLWSKMKAIYPFVGGTATSHKWNLKDPRDADAAFRLTFNGGWTHSSTGADPNGTNAYANSYLNNNQMAQNSVHISVYVRENIAGFMAEIGIIGPGPTRSSNYIFSREGVALPATDSFTAYATANQTNTVVAIRAAVTTSQGFTSVTRTSSTSQKLYKNGISLLESTQTSSTPSANPYYLGAINEVSLSTVDYYSSRQCAFATIGDGLTDTDATNLYNIVQRYQFQLGRAIEPDAQAFIDAAGITDATQQAAILDLVVRLKNDGLWSKMKAIYPFVGGTATTHKWNLKDPRDADAAFRLTFSGGWTHSANGALPNGTTGYANTFLTPSSSLSQNSTHVSYYSRTSTSNTGVDFGAESLNGQLYAFLNYSSISFPTPTTYFKINHTNTQSGVALGSNPSDAFFLLNRNNSTVEDVFVDNNKTSVSVNSSGLANINTYIAAVNSYGSVASYSNRQCAFATIGDGLTDNDATNLYNIVDLYQRRLGRNV